MAGARTTSSEGRGVRGVVKVLAVLVLLLLVGGLAVVAVVRARNAAQRAGCRNNLKAIG
jgi:hypothetical protein